MEVTPESDRRRQENDMASTTATLPTGHKVRTASKSPMVLFLVGTKGPFIEKRSARRDIIESAAYCARLRWVNLGLPAPKAFVVFTDGTGKVEEV